ncbi:unnamed protein product [Umbelopsis vinacea]
MSKSWINFVHSTATAHAKWELDSVDNNLSSHLDWLSDLENLEYSGVNKINNLSKRPLPTTTTIEDQLCLNLAAMGSWHPRHHTPIAHMSQPEFEEDNQTSIGQDATFMENIKAPTKESSKVTDNEPTTSGNIIQDPSQLADFIKDFFPDYQLEDIMSSPMKSQQNDVDLPSPPLSKPPSPIPPATGMFTPTEECPCDTKRSQNSLVSNDDPFREYFEEKLSTSQWTFLRASRPPPPSYSKLLPAKHILLQQTDAASENLVSKKINHITKGPDSKANKRKKTANGSKTLKKQTVDQVHETMKSSLPHARLATLAKYDIDVSSAPLKSRLLQMAEKTDSNIGKPVISVSKALTTSESRTSRNISMERINRLAQPKHTVTKTVGDGAASTCRTVTKSSSKPSSVSQKSQSAKHFGVTQVRQKRSQPMSLTAAAIALDTSSIDSTKRNCTASDSVLLSNEPDWVRPQNLQNSLEEQSKVDPDEIFGKMTPLEVDDIFRSKPTKLQAPIPSRPFRLRVNSCMTRVTHQEETAYRLAMGYAVC